MLHIASDCSIGVVASTVTIVIPIMTPRIDILDLTSIACRKILYYLSNRQLQPVSKTKSFLKTIKKLWCYFYSPSPSPSTSSPSASGTIAA
jgi:hypothetical protein